MKLFFYTSEPLGLALGQSKETGECQPFLNNVAIFLDFLLFSFLLSFKIYIYIYTCAASPDERKIHTKEKNGGQN